MHKCLNFLRQSGLRSFWTVAYENDPLTISKIELAPKQIGIFSFCKKLRFGNYSRKHNAKSQQIKFKNKFLNKYFYFS